MRHFKVELDTSGQSKRGVPPDYRKPEDVIAEVLGRYSVADLREQTNDDLDRADEMFYKSKAPIEIVELGETNLIRWWKIESGGKRYEVRRFKNFVFCSCPDFFFRKRACKHIAVTTGVYCERCRVLAAKVGKLCFDCDQIVHRFQKPTPAKAA